jgi:hypothetical protein
MIYAFVQMFDKKVINLLESKYKDKDKDKDKDKNTKKTN